MQLSRVPGLLVELVDSQGRVYKEFETNNSTAHTVSCCISPTIGDQYSIRFTIDDNFVFAKDCFKCEATVDGASVGYKWTRRPGQFSITHDYNWIGASLYGRGLVFTESSAGLQSLKIYARRLIVQGDLPDRQLPVAGQKDVGQIGRIKAEFWHLKVKPAPAKAERAINHPEVQVASDALKLDKLIYDPDPPRPVTFDEKQFKKGAGALRCSSSRTQPTLLKKKRNREQGRYYSRPYKHGNSKPFTFIFDYGYTSAEENNMIAPSGDLAGDSVAEAAGVQMTAVKEIDKPVIDVDMDPVNRADQEVSESDLPVVRSSKTPSEGNHSRTASRTTISETPQPSHDDFSTQPSSNSPDRLSVVVTPQSSESHPQLHPDTICARLPPIPPAPATAAVNSFATSLAFGDDELYCPPTPPAHRITKAPVAHMYNSAAAREQYPEAAKGNKSPQHQDTTPGIADPPDHQRTPLLDHNFDVNDNYDDNGYEYYEDDAYAEAENERLIKSEEELDRLGYGPRLELFFE